MTYEIIQINEQTWRIEEQNVRFFLLTGKDKALLIDSGMHVENAKEIAQSLTTLPIELLNTHADRDHIASNKEFEHFYMHPAELSNFHKTQNRQGTIIPVWDQDILDLGDRPLEIIHIPGHTPGSIAVLDKKNRVLISGDPIQDGDIFMFGIQREIHAYQHSLLKLKKYQDQFDTIYPSHGNFPVSSHLIEQLYSVVQHMINGEINYQIISIHGNSVYRYDLGVAAILSDIDFLSDNEIKKHLT